MRALARTGHTCISAADWLDGSSLPRRAVVLTFDDAYEDLVEHAMPVLIRLGFRATVFVVAGQVGGRNDWDSPLDGHRLMSEQDIRRWLAAGMDVGSHGLTHADLTKLDPEQVRSEARTSADVLTRLCGSPPRSFAYPYGAVTPAVAEAVGASFAIAFGLAEGRNGPHADPRNLRRTPVQSSDTRLDVILRARLGWSPLSRIRARLRVRDRTRLFLDRS